MKLNRQYIVNQDNQRVAVQLEIATFEKIETVLENYALVQLMNADDSQVLSIDEANNFNASLAKYLI